MHLQQLKGMQSSIRGIWKGYHLSIIGIRKGYLCREKWCIKGKGWTSGGASPFKSTPWVRYMVRERAIRYSVNTTLTELLQTEKKLELCLANLFCFTDLDAFLSSDLDHWISCNLSERNRFYHQIRIILYIFDRLVQGKAFKNDGYFSTPIS